MNSRDVIRVLKKTGWKLKTTEGSHQHFIHESIRGKVTVPHPKKDLPKGTFKSILTQIQMTREEFERWLSE